MDSSDQCAMCRRAAAEGWFNPASSVIGGDVRLRAVRLVRDVGTVCVRTDMGEAGSNEAASRQAD
jgi:hypothetical protein